MTSRKNIRMDTLFKKIFGLKIWEMIVKLVIFNFPLLFILY